MLYLIISYKDRGTLKYEALPVKGGALERGLFDWSHGRELMGMAPNVELLDLYIVDISDEEAMDINDGLAAPPKPRRL